MVGAMDIKPIKRPVALSSRQVAAQARGHTTISWDWKSSPDLGGLQYALAPLGIQVHEDPLYAGSDQYGFIFARRPLTDAELAAIGDRNCEDD